MRGESPRLLFISCKGQANSSSTCPVGDQAPDSPLPYAPSLSKYSCQDRAFPLSSGGRQGLLLLFISRMEQCSRFPSHLRRGHVHTTPPFLGRSKPIRLLNLRKEASPRLTNRFTKRRSPHLPSISRRKLAHASSPALERNQTYAPFTFLGGANLAPQSPGGDKTHASPPAP